MSYVDTDTGEIITAYLFVATFPYSQYGYVEATTDMREKAWLDCHVHMFDLTEKLLAYLSSLPHEVTYINTISLVHKYASIDYEDFYYTKRYRSVPVYSRSKLCLAKYTYHTAQKWADSNIRIYMSHPGIALTPLGLNAVGPKYAKLAPVVAPFFNSPEKSSLSVAYILSHSLPVGAIVGPNHCFHGWGYPTLNRTSRKVTTGAEPLIAFTEKEIHV